MIDGIKWNGFQLNNINNYNKLYHSSQQSMILPHMGLEGGAFEMAEIFPKRISQGSSVCAKWNSKTSRG